MVMRLVVGASNGMLDLRALEARSVSAEAAHILAGGTGPPPGVAAPTSFVGRVPLYVSMVGWLVGVSAEKLCE
jgi:hypothetical protein